MKPDLPIGAQYEYALQVTEAMEARFEGERIHPLYATAAMINHMEWAARRQVLSCLEEGEEAVGCHVDVRHLRPTPIGARVHIRSTVEGIEGNRVTHRVEAWNETEKIAEGSFTQAVVPLEKLYPEGLPQRKCGPSALPPLAQLASIDGRNRLTLDILRWESGTMACTRYDEWLVCRLTLETPARSESHEGAFLLRHEIEDWLAAIDEMSRSARSAYQSDFLEPVLAVWMEASEPGEFIVKLTLARAAENAPSPLVLAMEVSRQSLTTFTRQLEAQLEGFASKL